MTPVPPAFFYNKNMMKTSLISIMMFMVMMMILTAILNILHPIYLIILLMFYSLMTCFLMSMWSSNFMYSIMIFLIMISGILIIFLYFSSLISNEQNKISWSPYLLSNLLLNFIFLIFIYSKKYTYMYPSMSTSLNLSPLYTSNLTPQFLNIMKIFIYPNNYMTLISMFYLLTSLFIIIKICSLKSSSLRKIN
uniref:NADH dehydrogenase subunit 6 n=1 Tax=Crematogaster matsumurai TaxID=2905682 RepID=UPI001FCDFEDB|nr:NADH dehydrogenase subunit 6 [Crematogaster matsumurai]UNH90056.1 NADH dehydrogenase subunit 6 [Crematogaster matsumurai]